MDLFLKYLKQKLWLFVVGGTFSLIFTVSFFLYHLPVEAVIYPTLLCAFIGLLVLIFDFLRVKGRHKELAQIKSIPDAITATFPADNNIQNEDYREVIRLLCEEHNQYKSETNYKYAELKNRQICRNPYAENRRFFKAVQSQHSYAAPL